MLAATFNERDLDAYARNYEENAAMILPPEGNRASGRDAIRAAVEATFELRPSLQIDVVDTLQADGLALTHPRWSLTEPMLVSAWSCPGAELLSHAGSPTAAGASSSRTP